MADEHQDAVAALMRAFDARLAAAPLIDRRGAPRACLIEASRAAGPVRGDLAFWVTPQTPAAMPMRSGSRAERS
jgi:hypothetical protein